MLVDSGLLQDSEQYAHVGGRPMCVYGDPAYPHRVHLKHHNDYRNRQPTAEMEAFNKLMTIVWVFVQWLFVDIRTISDF